MKSSVVLALASLALAQDSSMSLCDKYTTALLMDNTPQNQLGLLTKLVNTVVIGNYTMPNMNSVPGILAPGEYMGTQVNLAKYFDGSLVSTNRNGMATSMSFLDGGGAMPLMQDKPASDTTSNQYRLLTHLYSYFGLLLQCSGVGQDGFPAYGGQGSQYDVHRYMALDQNEFGYFVMQVGLAAQSFGVSQEDITTAAGALQDAFGNRCSAPAAIDPSQGEQLQAMCTEDSCPEAENPVCDQYQPVVEPAMASGSGGMSPTSSMMPSGSGSMMPSSTGEMTMETGAASAVKAGAGLLGSFAAAFWLL